MPLLPCSSRRKEGGRSKCETFLLLEYVFYTHHRPEKGNTKRKEELPGEIAADLTASPRGEIRYLDYFKLSKEKLHEEADPGDQNQ